LYSWLYYVYSVCTGVNASCIFPPERHRWKMQGI